MIDKSKAIPDLSKDSFDGHQQIEDTKQKYMEFMTVPEVAEYLRISKTEVYNLVKMKGFPAAKLGKNWRISKVELNRWFASFSYSKKYSINK